MDCELEVVEKDCQTRQLNEDAMDSCKWRTLMISEFLSGSCSPVLSWIKGHATKCVLLLLSTIIYFMWLFDIK